jgi:hypothetical protein
MGRINLMDSTMDGVMKMVEGNPGAVTAVLQMIQHPDPRGLLLFMYLDDWQVYGSDIWVLYKDCCGQDIDNMFRLMGAVNSGKFSLAAVKNYINLHTKFNFEEMGV